jgi:hypothetical protein
MVATALDDPRGLNRKKAKAKGKINLASGKVGKKGKGKKAPTVVSVDGEPAEGTAAAAGGDKVLDMQSREKKLKRELNKRAKKFMKGDTVNTKNVKDKKTKAHVKYANELADKAATDAALHEKVAPPIHAGCHRSGGRRAHLAIQAGCHHERGGHQRGTESIRPIAPDPRAVLRGLHPERKGRPHRRTERSRRHDPLVRL